MGKALELVRKMGFAKAKGPNGSLSFDEQGRRVRGAWREATAAARMAPDFDAYPTEVYPDAIILQDGDGYVRIPYTLDDDGDAVFDSAQATAVEQVWQPAGPVDDDDQQLLPTDKAFSIDFEIRKFDDDMGVAFGFASVVNDDQGQILTDLQGDQITIDVLEKAAYQFMLDDEAGSNDMHAGPDTGRPIESFVITPEKLNAFAKGDAGVLAQLEKSLPYGWWTGFAFARDTDAGEEAWAKVKAAERPMLSIEGSARKVAV